MERRGLLFPKGWVLEGVRAVDSKKFLRTAKGAAHEDSAAPLAPLL